MKKILLLLCVFIGIVFGDNFKEIDGVSSIKLYSTTERLRNDLDVNLGANEQWQPVYKIRLDNLSSSQVYIISGSLEYTNDTGHSVNVVTKIVVNSSYDDEPDENGAFIISAGGGPNTPPDVHHQLLVRPSYWIPSQYYGARNITLMARAVSSAAVTGDIVTLTSAPGELKIMVIE